MSSLPGGSSSGRQPVGGRLCYVPSLEQTGPIDIAGTMQRWNTEGCVFKSLRGSFLEFVLTMNCSVNLHKKKSPVQSGNHPLTAELLAATCWDGTKIVTRIDTIRIKNLIFMNE